MRYTLTIGALFLTLAFVFSSCKKQYYCHCDHKTTVDGDTVKSVQDVYEVRAQKEDAEAECKYYETEETYLTNYAIVYHYCQIEDEEHPKEEVEQQ